MRKQLGFLVLGLSLGAAGSYLLLGQPADMTFAAPPARDLGGIAPISVQAAEQHRAERYAEITTIAETLALPTDFAQTEALYVIAGRSTSAELQDLIYDAARVSERLDRAAALQILFLRLTELDPRSAVAITRSPAFASERGLERAVWENWGRVDLDAALDAAAELSGGDRARAARSLYAALRGIDDTRAQYIESTLGIAPDRNARMLRINALAASNPTEAIAYIETFANPQERMQYVGTLAMGLAQRFGYEQASQYGELLQDPTNRQMFDATLNNLRAQQDPGTALQQVMSAPMSDQNRNRAIQAFQQLVTQDLDAAEAWYRRTDDPRLKRMFGQQLAARMGSQDPQRALAWVRANAETRNPQMLNTVLAQVAQRDPELAIMEAQSIADYRTRSNALSSIISTAANKDPARAAQLLNQLGDAGNRQALISQVAQQWARRDWQAAFDWLSSEAVPNRKAALESMGQALMQTDLDAATQLLDRMPRGSGLMLRQQLASQYAQRQSIDAAERFIARYADDPGYPQLLANVASAAVAREPDAALRLAARIDSGELRDRVYADVLARRAEQDPRGALQQLDLLSSEAGRTQATHQIIERWQQYDPAGAANWVAGLAPGPARDGSISTIVRRMEPGSDQALALAQSISDPHVRSRTLLNQFYTLARNDPDRAEQLLGTLTIDPNYRRQIQSAIDGAR